MQEECSISDLEERAVKIKEYFKREEGNGLKMHELLHVCRDILLHGPPMDFDS